MAYMPDEIVLARMITALDLEFELALHYHNEGYESDNDYGIPPRITRLVCVYSINLTDYTTAKCQLSPFTLRHPRDLPFREGVCWCLTFDEAPLLTSAADSEDEELDDLMWDEEPVLDSRE